MWGETFQDMLKLSLPLVVSDRIYTHFGVVRRESCPGFVIPPSAPAQHFYFGFLSSPVLGIVRKHELVDGFSRCR